MFSGDVFMSFSSKNKKFQISSDGAIQDVCPMVKMYTCREIFFHDENYWLSHTLRLNKWYLGTKRQYVSKLGKEKNACCFFSWKWKFGYVEVYISLHARAY